MQDLSGLIIFFSSLDRRKEAKEDQGIRDAGQVWPGTCLEIQRQPNFRHPTYMNVPGQTSPPSEEGLSFFCFFSFLKERKEGLIRESNKASGSSFLALMQEKKQKKIKASGMPAKFDLVPVWRSNADQISGIQLIWMYPAKLPRHRQRAFSSLDARKEAKEDQGVRDASQVWPGTCLEV